MKIDSIIDGIKEVVQEKFEGIEIKDIIPELELFDDGLGLSSIDIVIFFTSLEEKFSIEFPDNSFIELRTISDVVECIKHCLEEQK